MTVYPSGNDDRQASAVSREHKQNVKSLRTAENWGIFMFILLAGTFVLDFSWIDQMYVQFAQVTIVVAAIVAFGLAVRFEKEVKTAQSESSILSSPHIKRQGDEYVA